MQAALMVDVNVLQEDSIEVSLGMQEKASERCVLISDDVSMKVGGLTMRDSRLTAFGFDLETQGEDN